MKHCLIVPHYNHERQFIEFIPKLLSTGLHILIVDDGSQDASYEKVKEAVKENTQVSLFRHAFNRGKGAAVTTGVHHARALGFTHVLQIDADGQHEVNDISRFIVASNQSPDTIICGRPTFDESAPASRKYGRRITDFWVMLETWSLKIKDGLCGFRVYPLSEMERVIDHHFIGPRMDFDTEILVKSVWENVPLKFIDTQVIYPEASVSHFRYLRDNLTLIRLHTRLMFGMLPRIPWLVARLIKG